MQQNGKLLLRKQMINQLHLLSETEKEKIELILHNHLFTSTLWKNARIIGLTVSTNIEWDTIRIMEQAWNEQKLVTVPKSFPSTSLLKFYSIDSLNDLHVGYANILEPEVTDDKLIHKEQIDLLIVPGIVFNLSGYRIGFGGGYYDRFLSDFPNITISLVSSLQLVEHLPIETHDVRVQYLITENGLYTTNHVSEV